MYESFHIVDRVIKRPDGVLVTGKFTGGRLTDGPEHPGDIIKSEEDGKFYQIAQIITIVHPVDDDIPPKIDYDCPACEFIIDMARTTTLGGCGKHEN